MTTQAPPSAERVHRRALPGLAVLLAVTALVAGATLTVPPLPAAASTPTVSTPFHGSFHGTFTITFGTGEGGTHELFFHGRGTATHLGHATVDGYSRLRPSATDPACKEIVYDDVALTAADGSRVTVVNDALDCMEVTPDGRILIHGRGTYRILEGTARFAGATGTGRVSTEAVVTDVVPGGVTGTFDPLAFDGTVRP